jgi:predicted ATPase
MITRIKINGFKSLVDTELYFGAFTCIAGANAIGKSNFFDALIFLSNLADNTILQAAKSIRSENQKHANIKDIFFNNGKDYFDEMSFEIDMLVAKTGIDDLGQIANARITSLRYTLVLKLNDEINNEISSREPIEIIKEELRPIGKIAIKENLYFSYEDEWLDSILIGKRVGNPFISTEKDKIKLHQDGNGGKSAQIMAMKMPRTLLSTVTAESPTAFLVRQEMRNWTMLQFEPSALRQSNATYEAKNAEIKSNGLNLPATLYRLHITKKDTDVYQELTNKLKELVEDVTEIRIDKDDKRDLLTLQIEFKGGLTLPAQSLSDGTLRFLGLAIIEQDSMRSGLICLEEPENGINPKKVQQMVELLIDMATDTEFAIDNENPLRQVIINTHSPIVVSGVDISTLYLAKNKEVTIEKFNKKIKCTGFAALPNTWRTEGENPLAEKTSIGEIMQYLDGIIRIEEEIDKTMEDITSITNKSKNKQKTVREYLGQFSLDFQGTQ